MNPPFGTRKKGADMEFLSAAMKVKAEIEKSLLLFSESRSTRLNVLYSIFCCAGCFTSSLFLA